MTTLPERPLLTIAIPTYNRSRFLARLLDSLTVQSADAPQLELLVSDNASPDETPQRLEEYRGRGLNFRSIRNTINLGADGNILQCFEEARGKYVWIVGDDDVLLDGALGVILHLLATDEFDIVHLRGKDYAEGSPPPARLERRPSIEVIDDPLRFALRTHVYLTFITGNIINKERVLALSSRPFRELLGTSLVQLSWTYTALRHFRKGVFIREPVVAVGSDDRGGYALFTVFGINLKRLTEEWLVDPALVRIVLNGTILKALPSWVLQSRRGAGSFSEEPFDVLLDSLFRSNMRYRFFVSPLFKLPVSLGRIWLLLGQIVNRFDRALGNPLLR